MRIGVIGATGATGGRIVSQLVEAGHEVRAVVRSPRSAKKKLKGVEDVVEFDLTQPGEQLVPHLTGLDAVINAAASSGGKADEVDRDGVISAIDAAKQAGVPRWIQVSMWGVGDPSRLQGSLRDIAEAKQQADDHLAKSGLTWTAVRPPWLTNKHGTGQVTVGDEVEEGSLSREDLAAVTIACLTEPAARNRAFEVTAGDQPMEKALSGLG